MIYPYKTITANSLPISMKSLSMLFQVDLSYDITLKKMISGPKDTQLLNLSNSIDVSEDH